MNKLKNPSIELFRFIFAMLIAIMHSRINTMNGFFDNSFVGVSFFFIVTGFFLAKSISNTDSYHMASVFHVSLVLKRKLSFYPAYFITWIAAFTYSNLINYTNAKDIITNLLRGFPELFLLQQLSLNTSRYLMQCWFLSAMTISCIIISIIIYIKHNKSLLIAIVILTTYFLAAKYQTTNIFDEKLLIFRVGVIRAIGTMSIGALIYKVHSMQVDTPFQTRGSKHVNHTLTFPPKIPKYLNILSVLCVLSSIIYSIFPIKLPYSDFVVTAIIAIFVYVELTYSTVVSKLLSELGRIPFILGKYSIYIYLTHGLAKAVSYIIYYHLHISEFVYYITFIVITAIMSHILYVICQKIISLFVHLDMNK